MVTRPDRGEVWWAEMSDKRRPVLVLTRSAAIPVLRSVLVAPITRTVRHIPTEVFLDQSDGMPAPCVASLDNVTTADKALLLNQVSVLSPTKMGQVCRALAVAVQC